MSDLKEFLGKLRHDFVTDNQSNRDVNYFEKELGKFFLGEVARLKEEVCDKWEEYNNCTESEIIGKLWGEAQRLEERLLVYKELAGVE